MSTKATVDHTHQPRKHDRSTRSCSFRPGNRLSKIINIKLGSDLSATETHVVHGPGEVEAQVGRSEADNGQLADAPVLKLRLSQEVEGDEVRETDRVESGIACD